MNRAQLRDRFDMTGRVVLVTGGTQGIGLALAEGYVCANAKVAVVSRNPDNTKEAEQHLRDLGGEAIGFVADLGHLEDTARVIGRTVEEFGGLDVLVNNAGTSGQQRVGSFTRRGVAAHLRHEREGPGLLAPRGDPPPEEEWARGRAQYPDHRRLFELAGVSHVRVEQGRPVLAHPRAAAELAQYGIRVNGLVPGPFETALLRSQVDDTALVGQMTMLKRVAHPDEAVGPALLLTSDAGSFVTGQVLFVDGGHVVAR